MTRPTAKTMSRYRLTEWEPGAHLHAPFSSHLSAGVASLVPLGAFYFFSQPLGTSMSALAFGGYIVAPMIILVHCLAWALMSRGVQRFMKTAHHSWQHIVAYAVTGGVALFAVAMLALTLVQLSSGDGLALSENSRFTDFLTWSFPFGAAGSVIGAIVLLPLLQWYQWRSRPSAKDVFEFEDRRRDKDEFEQL